jgi:Flp pilus assembly protein TadG
MRWRTRRNGRTERGAAAVEFGFIVIPLMLIICGIVNFGVIFAQQLSLDNATRAAARAAVVDGDVDVAARAQAEFNSAIVRDQAGALNITFPAPGVGATCAGSELGEVMVVRGEVESDVLIPWVFPETLLPGTFDLESEAMFQCEFS